MLSIFGFRRSGLHSENIASSLRLRDGKTDNLLARQRIRDNASLEFVASKVGNRRKADNQTREEAFIKKSEAWTTADE